jgi:hypothetical protein
MTDKLRGREKYRTRSGKWFYEDTDEPTADNPRSCGHCGKERTKEGHDGCLGNLGGNVMNACCGHGVGSEAYIQFKGGRRIDGGVALDWVQRRIDNEFISKQQGERK